MPAVPQMDGQVFTGWYTDEGCTDLFGFGKMPDEDIILYAGWTTSPYVIRFVTNGGTTVTPIIFDSEIEVSAEEAPSTEREGYSFAGWYADPELTQELTSGFVPAGGISVYAKWDINSYSMVFVDAMDGTEMSSYEAEYASELEAPEEIDDYVEKLRAQLKQLLENCDGIQLK